MYATGLDPRLEERRYRQHSLKNLITFKYGLQIITGQKFSEHSECIALSYTREFLGLSKYTLKHLGAKVNRFPNIV